MATPNTDVHWHIRNFGATGGSNSSYETGESSPRPGASARIVLGLISVRTLSLDEVGPSHREPFADGLHSVSVKSVAEVTVGSCRAAKANINGPSRASLVRKVGGPFGKPSELLDILTHSEWEESRKFGYLTGYYYNHRPFCEIMSSM